ncbi:L-threonylcarbamoyladenylate synthase [Bacillus sp. JCM 19041]|uniref:L-threonylcarbamoyladenylate synthase n=1 Tax=Bacillus sp. JCM 19041 TaxID=1460637 RepID=UPI0006CF6D41
MNYKQTKVWTVDNHIEDQQQTNSLNEAALWIKDNKLIVFPTETVYGLGANALSEEAVATIFSAKGRPSDNPLIVHIGHEEQLNQLVKTIPDKAKKLIEAFWPGALTLVFKAKPSVAPNVTAGLDTVGVRMPSHPIAKALLQACDVPVAAPSANRSGRPSPTSADHVLIDLDGRVDGVIDGGATGIGLESTVLSVVHDPPMLYRPGGVTVEEIEAVIGPISIDPALQESEATPRSPGMKYTHYSPQAKVVLVDKPVDLQRLADDARIQGERVGIFATRTSFAYSADEIVKSKSLEHVAQELYATLREFDKRKVTVIYVETVPLTGVGLAIMNRLEKAAGGERV